MLSILALILGGAAIIATLLPLSRNKAWWVRILDFPRVQLAVPATIVRSGQRIWLNCVHPPPPVPGESAESSERDSALLLVGRRVSDATGPVVVCGDLNDVAWSHTTRLFQKISGLLEPRKGCGFFSTFHARTCHAADHREAHRTMEQSKPGVHHG